MKVPFDKLTRQEKINLLKGIASGTRSIEEVRPTKHIALLYNSETDTYQELKAGEQKPKNSFILLDDIKAKYPTESLEITIVQFESFS